VIVCPSLAAVYHPSICPLWGCEPSGNFNPLRQAASLLVLDVRNIGVTFAPTAHSVLLFCVPIVPVFVVLFGLLLVFEVRFRERRPGELFGRGVGGTMLDGGVAVADIAEVVDVAGTEEDASGERMDGGISPLHRYVSSVTVIHTG
jgi:hypothetical protein